MNSTTFHCLISSTTDEGNEVDQSKRTKNADQHDGIERRQQIGIDPMFLLFDFREHFISTFGPLERASPKYLNNRMMMMSVMLASTAYYNHI